MNMPLDLARRAKRKLSHLIGLTKPRVSAVGVQIEPIAGMHYNEVLRSESEVDRAGAAFRWLHPVRWKTWDLLKCAQFVLERVPDRKARILDAGCNGSPILELLFTAGYRNLFGCDYVDTDKPQVPGITFHRGDLMNTPWPDAHFAAVSCVSVIEHGFDAARLLREMARLVQPGGYLLISTDYANPKIDTSDIDQRTSFNLPWLIFSRSEIEAFIATASTSGFDLVEPVRWDQEDLMVSFWGKQYTFIFLAFQRRRSESTQ